MSLMPMQLSVERNNLQTVVGSWMYIGNVGCELKFPKIQGHRHKHYYNAYIMEWDLQLIT